MKRHQEDVFLNREAKHLWTSYYIWTSVICLSCSSRLTWPASCASFCWWDNEAASLCRHSRFCLNMAFSTSSAKESWSFKFRHANWIIREIVYMYCLIQAAALNQLNTNFEEKSREHSLMALPKNSWYIHGLLFIQEIQISRSISINLDPSLIKNCMSSSDTSRQCKHWTWVYQRHIFIGVWWSGTNLQSLLEFASFLDH